VGRPGPNQSLDQTIASGGITHEEAQQDAGEMIGVGLWIGHRRTSRAGHPTNPDSVDDRGHVTIGQRPLTDHEVVCARVEGVGALPRNVVEKGVLVPRRGPDRRS
jgi:hypothetical protein